MLRVLTLLCAVSVAASAPTCPSHANRPNLVHGKLCGSATCAASFTYPHDEVTPFCDPCTGVVSKTQSIIFSKSGSGYTVTVISVGLANQTIFAPCNVCGNEAQISCGGGDDDDGSNTTVIVVSVLCGLLVLVAVAGGVWWYIKRQQRAMVASQQEQEQTC